jgi:general secretion pathway protein E
MVGEVRDQETAQLALEAAMTGHLLFTSIHANNAVSVIQRLENLGCNRMHIAQSLALVLVQRLARRLCPNCATVEPASPVLVESLTAHGLIDAPVALPRPVGCIACQHTGFAGRVAVVEWLQVTDDVRAQLMADHGLAHVQKTAAQGKLFTSFGRYASFLMSRRIIGPSDALLTVAE